MPTLILSNNSGTNPQSINLTNYLQLALEAKADPASPQFSTRQFTTSLLKEGATFTLENVKLKEQVFPLLIGPNTNSSLAVATIIAINQILETPGAVAEWQDDGGIVSPTYFTLASGQLDVNYNYRESAQHWISCTLRLFSQPYGTTAAPRFYCAASAVGPLLMISPYASGGVQAIAASTQAGVAGFGGRQQGASSGIFYGGNPSLAGDAPAVLQISYTAPVAAAAMTNEQPAAVPYIAVSWLPDANYQPLITASQISTTGWAVRTAGVGAVAGTYLRNASGGAGAGDLYTFTPYPGIVPVTWAGNHRLFAIARASEADTNAQPYLQTAQNSAIPFITTATPAAGMDWGVYDLGVFTMRASEHAPNVQVQSMLPGVSGLLDLTAFVMLPDATTWFLSPPQLLTPFTAASISPAPAYGWWPGAAAYFGNRASAPYTNTFLIDDTLPDQFLYQQTVQGYAPSIAGMGASSVRITQFTRGIIPRPDPARGLPILAIMGVGQAYVPPLTFWPGASWPNSQQQPAMAQVSVLERARYTLS
jgi:hypothetical protein